MSNDIRIKEALSNAEANIAWLATLSDVQLEEKLEIINKQSIIAEAQKLTSSIQLLEIWRSQIIQARIYKHENQIPDAPDEIALAIAAMEAQEEKTEQRKEVLNEYKQEITEEPESEPKPKGNEGTQLTLF